MLHEFFISGYIVSSGGQTGGSIGGIAAAVWTSGLGFYLQTSTHSWSVTGSIPCCLLDTWYHAVFTWDSVDFAVYFNGTEILRTQGTVRDAYTDGGHDDFMVGRPNNVADYFGQLVIDEMYYWEKTLTPNDVDLLYNQHSHSEYTLLAKKCNFF